MKTTAIRMYGKQDLRMESFDLPEIKDDEILAHIVSDSICMSSYKAAKQGSDHKRVPADIAENPVMILALRFMCIAPPLLQMMVVVRISE